MANTNDSLENWLDFRRNENPKVIRLECTECGGPAEGNCTWTDGTGEICDKCVAEDDAAEVPVEDQNHPFSLDGV